MGHKKHDRPHLVPGAVTCWLLLHEQRPLQHSFRELECGTLSPASFLWGARSRRHTFPAEKCSAHFRTSTESCPGATPCLLADLRHPGLEIHLPTYIHYIFQHTSIWMMFWPMRYSVYLAQNLDSKRKAIYHSIMVVCFSVLYILTVVLNLPNAETL